MKTVLINLKEDSSISSQKINVNAIISLHSSFVDVPQHLNEGDQGVLIQLNHKHPVSKLNLTDVSPYVLLFFNDELEYKSSAVSIKSGSGSFVFQTQYKNILILKIPHNLNLHQILSLEILTKNIN